MPVGYCALRGLSEQAEATRHIASRIEKISQGTEALSIRAEEAKLSAVQLAQMAANLNKLVGNFRLV